MLLLLIAIVSLSPSSVAYATANISLDSLSTGLLHDGTSFEYISIINTGSFPATPEDMTIEINTAGDDLEIPGGIELGHCDMILGLTQAGLRSLTDNADFVRLFSDGGQISMDSMDFADAVPDETTGDIVMWDDSSVRHCEYSIHRATVSYDYCEDGLGGNNACGSDSPRFVMSSISVFGDENPAPSASSSASSASVSSSPAPASPPADPAPAPANGPTIGMIGILNYDDNAPLAEYVTVTNNGKYEITLDNFRLEMADMHGSRELVIYDGVKLGLCDYVTINLPEGSLSETGSNGDIATAFLYDSRGNMASSVEIPQYDRSRGVSVSSSGNDWGVCGSADLEQVASIDYEQCASAMDSDNCKNYKDFVPLRMNIDGIDRVLEYGRTSSVPPALPADTVISEYFDEIAIDVSEDDIPTAAPTPASPPMVLDPGNSAKDDLIVHLQERNEDLEAENDSLRLLLSDLLSYLGHMQEMISDYGISADSP